MDYEDHEDEEEQVDHSADFFVWLLVAGGAGICVLVFWCSPAWMW
jgi:hypothetical protein